MELTTEQLAKLLHKSRHESKDRQKRFLRHLGGNGSTVELDAMLLHAARNPEAVAQSERMESEQPRLPFPSKVALEPAVSQMLEALRNCIKAEGLSLQEVADRCGWSERRIAAYLRGEADPALSHLAKLATALGCAWTLKKIDPM